MIRIRKNRLDLKNLSKFFQETFLPQKQYDSLHCIKAGKLEWYKENSLQLLGKRSIKNVVIVYRVP
jgi:hypothetical protein